MNTKNVKPIVGVGERLTNVFKHSKKYTLACFLGLSLAALSNGASAAWKVSYMWYNAPHGLVLYNLTDSVNPDNIIYCAAQKGTTGSSGSGGPVLTDADVAGLVAMLAAARTTGKPVAPGVCTSLSIVGP